MKTKGGGGFIFGLEVSLPLYLGSPPTTPNTGTPLAAAVFNPVFAILSWIDWAMEEYSAIYI
jgi:hypothetical protein